MWRENAGSVPDGLIKMETCSSIYPIETINVYQLACYPRITGSCRDIIRSIRASGLEGVCQDRLRQGYPPGVAGRGHSSIVLLGLFEGREVAVKVRRTDSRRDSLLGEFYALSIASRFGAAPHPYYGDNNIIIMDYIKGHLLGHLRSSYLYRFAISEALDAARALDAAGILHHELVRPWKHVIYNGNKAFIIDYDSVGKGCGNVVKIVSGILTSMPGGVEILKQMRYLLKLYNKNCPEHLYHDIKRRVLLFINKI